MEARKLIVVGGPNGTGKSTFALHHCAASGIRYIGADQIASRIAPTIPTPPESKLPVNSFLIFGNPSPTASR